MRTSTILLALVGGALATEGHDHTRNLIVETTVTVTKQTCTGGQSSTTGDVQPITKTINVETLPSTPTTTLTLVENGNGNGSILTLTYKSLSPPVSTTSGPAYGNNTTLTSVTTVVGPSGTGSTGNTTPTSLVPVSSAGQIVPRFIAGAVVGLLAILV